MSNWNRLLGKVFKRGGGRYPGYWIVVAISPGDGVICLGFDYENNIVGACNYQPYYVDRKKEVGRVNLEDLRFKNNFPEPEEVDKPS